jgi:hypothetical protein
VSPLFRFWPACGEEGVRRGSDGVAWDLLRGRDLVGGEVGIGYV